MKQPKTPPDIGPIGLALNKSPEALLHILTTVSGPLVGTEYLHWDKLIRLKAPADLTHESWWLGLKLYRQANTKTIPLQDCSGTHFSYLVCDPMPERFQQIDQGAGGIIQMPEQITNQETKDQYYVKSLIEEAITSSILEGAATTRRVAKEMIRSGRKPRDRSERMILNNFRTMQSIATLKDEPLSIQLILNLHKLVSADTLDDPTAEGRFRNMDETVVVADEYGEVFHDPPPANELDARMKAMCDFANGKTPKHYLHPVIRAVLLHFWLAYDHPFIDGNGRAARALFYWSMLRNGYWLFEFISISSIILKGPSKYARAFLLTETDDNDLTYFILYHLEVIRRAIESLHEYIARKTDELRTVEGQLKELLFLNHRQRALLGHALRHPKQTYTIESHRMSHNVVYETARSDLFELMERGILEGKKIRRRWHFTPVIRLEEAIKNLSD